jgi:hypothetical protein
LSEMLERSRSKYYYRSAKFVSRKYLRGYKLNPEPTFDEDGLNFFKDAIKNSSYMQHDTRVVSSASRPMQSSHEK